MNVTWFLFAYLLLHGPSGQGHLTIVGLFPDYADDQVHFWIKQAMEMFNASFILAERYKLFSPEHRLEGRIVRVARNINHMNEFKTICELVTENDPNTNIVGIVGPRGSASVRILGSWASQVGIPLISYAATSSELNSKQIYSTFHRTAPSDALLAQAIVQLFQDYQWKTFTIIVEKDDYGYDGLRILTEIYHRQISMVERIIYDPHTDQFQANISDIFDRARSRIILVWANRSSCTRILHHAAKGNLLNQRYIWITTNWVDANKSSANFKGVLTVVPIIADGIDLGINETLQREVLNLVNHPPNHSADEICSNSPYPLYAFDAVWTLIQALHKSHEEGSLPSLQKSSCCFNMTLKNAENYCFHVENSRMSGASGGVRFSNQSTDRINGTAYALCQLTKTRSNVVKNQSVLLYDPVMVYQSDDKQWHNRSRLVHETTNHESNDSWPYSKTKNVPNDFPELRNLHLRVRVIEAPPFISIRDCSQNIPISCGSNNPKKNIMRANNTEAEIYGFVIDFLHELAQERDLTYKIDVAPSTTSYHDLVSSVAQSDRDYDMVISGILITSNRLLKVDFSVPFHENTFRLIIRDDGHSRSLTPFSFFKPFTLSVWLTIVGVIIAASLLIYLFEHQQMVVVNQQSRVQNIFVNVCRVMTSIVIMTGDVPLTRNSSRLTVLGLYTCGAILIAIYTANLSSFLTLNRSQPIINGIDDIKNGRMDYSRIGIVTNSAISDYYLQTISKHYYYPLSSPDEIYPCLLNETIDAAIWTGPVLEYAVDNVYCGQLTMVGSGFVKSSFGVVLPQDWRYKRDLDLKILDMHETGQFEIIEKTWFGQRKCPASLDGNVHPEITDIETFPIETMSGIFLSFLLFIGLAIGIHLWECRIPIGIALVRMVKRA